MKIKITKSVISEILDMFHKKDLIIAGRNGFAKICYDNGKTFLTLHLKGQKEQQTVFYFIENLSFVGFMYEKYAPKEFVNHATKIYEVHRNKVIWLNKFDLCLAMIDVLEFIRE